MVHPEQFWGLICVSVLLGTLAALIVGSQDRSDARFVAGVVLGVLGPLVLAILARVAGARDEESRVRSWGAFGFFAALLVGTGLGYAVAAWRESRQPPFPDISDEPIPPDDELF